MILQTLESDKIVSDIDLHQNNSQEILPHDLVSKHQHNCLRQGLKPNKPRGVSKPTIWILTRSDTNQAVQLLEMARNLNFVFRKKRYCTIQVTNTKALISFAVTTKLICVLVFAYAKCWFSQTRLIYY